MRRWAAETNGQTPPPDRVSYPRWCLENGRRAYGDPKQLDTMYEALESSKDWEAARAAWCERHGLDEADLPMSGHSDLPWDPDFAL